MNWTHARHVEKLAVSLFDQLRRLHGYGSFERSVLSNAALLHDIGVSIDFYNHHDHSAYLILNAELPGFTHRQIALMAQIALYHRRGTPHEHPFTGLLTREDDDRIEKLSALLRLAEYLERSRTQVVQSIKCGIRDEAVTLTCVVRGDAATEMWSTDQNAGLFRRVFKRDVILKTRTASQRGPAGELQSIQSAGPLWGRVQEIMSLKTRT
jgi:exopolyphosphatase/guanosine-5'-triphosphate,3'-diphosphate pyrophosphatase